MPNPNSLSHISTHAICLIDCRERGGLFPLFVLDEETDFCVCLADQLVLPHSSLSQVRVLSAEQGPVDLVSNLHPYYPVKLRKGPTPSDGLLLAVC